MRLALPARQALAPRGLASLVLSLAAMGCPGPEPATVSGEGGGAASTGAGPITASSSTATGAGGATTGAGGAAGVGGAGGEGTTTSSGVSAPAGAGGQGGAGGAGGCDAVLESDPENCGACGRRCSEADAEQLACGDGRCKPICKDGFSSVTAPDAPADDDGCETPWRRVFVTRDRQLLPFESADGGDIGAAAADALCQGLATELGGTWRAWISDGLLPPPSERFTRHEVPYWLLDGTRIAMTFDDLIDGALDAPIHVTESGISLFELFEQQDTFPVWTATDAFGEGTASNCASWAPGQGEDQLGHVGVVAEYEAMNLDASAWTQHPTPRSCLDQGVRLYCFEQ